AILQSLVDTIALAVIVGDMVGDVVIPGGDPSVLHHARSTDETELLQLDHLLDESRRSVAVAEAPARHPVRLAEAVEDEYVLVELRRTVELAIVAEGLVDLIAQEQHVAGAGQQGQVAQPFARVNSTRRIGGAVDEDHLGPWR